MAERKDASIAALINTIDLERRKEATGLVDGDAYGPNEHSGGCKDNCDAHGVLLGGKGWSAGAQEVRPVMVTTSVP
jgi:hypothetical protein